MKDEIHEIIEDYRKGEIGTDDAIYEILRLFSVSKRFNYNNFLSGMIFGLIVMLIICLTAI